MDYFAMRQLRELRELGNDMGYLTGQMRGRLAQDRYDKLYRELNRRRESLQNELDEHLKTL